MSLIFVAMCAVYMGQEICQELPPQAVMVEVEDCRAGLPALEMQVRIHMAERGWTVTDFAAFCQSGAEG